MAKGGRPGATHARAIENMNEAQLTREIAKAQRTIDRNQAKIDSIGNAFNAQTANMREQYPLGAGGLSRSQAQKYTGKLSAQAAKQGREMTAAINNRDAAQKRLSSLQKAQKQVKGTGKTVAQLQSQATQSTPRGKGMKWTTAQKETYSGGTLRPRILKSGAYEIRGRSIMRVYKNGVEIGRATKLADAKAIAERN